jgi:hypothetical protein
MPKAFTLDWMEQKILPKLSANDRSWVEKKLKKHVTPETVCDSVDMSGLII